MIVTQGVHLNDLAIARINAERQGSGASSMAATASIQPGSGGEIVGATQAQLDQNPQLMNEATFNEALGSLPSVVDNSTLAAFPPIRSQGRSVPARALRPRTTR